MPFECLSSSSSSDGTITKQGYRIPKGYTLVKVLGSGSYGTVLDCLKNNTEEHVAIKIPQIKNLDHEVEILKKLKCLNPDESNIIKYKGEMIVKNTRLLVLEKLDMTLRDYVRDLTQPMQLEHIRMVIQQLAKALETTKSAGIIHTDLKMDNIMMVDHVNQPFKVKLIDFGMAIYSSEAKAGKLHQVLAYRAPEIILGLPYSEAIDVWSLGCVMARMVARISIFGAESEYGALQQMIYLMGLPPQHLIEAGQRSRTFFKKMPDGLWRLKTPTEYFGYFYIHTPPKCHTFRTLNEMKTMYSETDNPAEADERRECIELLKAMVRWDEKDRITPSGILNHPFITKSHLSSCSHISSCNEPEPSASISLFIMVKPADPENRINTTGLPDEDTDSSEYKDLKDSSAYKDADCGEDSDTDGDVSDHCCTAEDREDRKNSEVSEKPVKKKVDEDNDADISSDCETTEDRKQSEDNKKPVNKEISEDEDSETSDTDKDTEDSENSDTDKDAEDSEDKEKPVDKEISESEVSDDSSSDGDTEVSEKEQSKKKKKNCFRRFFSWMKKFCCCCVSDVMD